MLKLTLEFPALEPELATAMLNTLIKEHGNIIKDLVNIEIGR